jgi:hypothetical protein
MIGIGSAELVSFVVFALSAGGLLGLPIAVPPLPPDPVVGRVAPDECLFHFETAGLATADDASTNLTERMLSHPEMREFLASVAAQLAGAARRAVPAPPDVVDAVATLVETALTRPVAFTVERLSPRPDGAPPEVVASLVIRVGDRGRVIERAAESILNITNADPPEEVRVGGIALRRTLLSFAGELTWGLHDGSYVVALGPGAIESLVARLTDVDRGAPAWKAELVERLPVERRSTLTYLDAGAVITMLGGLPAPDRERFMAVLAASGIAKLETVEAVTGMTAEGTAAALWLDFTAAPEGLFAKPETGIGARQLARIPAEATLAQSWSLDLSKTLAAVLDVVAAADPRAADEFRAGLEQVRAVVGIDLDRHVLQTLGPDWSVVSLPTTGGMLPNLAIVAGVRDRPTLAQTHKAVLGLLRNSMADATTKAVVREVSYRGQTLYCLEVSGPEIVFPLTPTWCLTDDALYVTLSPQLMKTLLARTPADGDMGDVAEVRAAVAGGEPDLVGALDPHALVGTLCSIYEMAAPAARGLLRQRGIDLDLPQLPPSSAIMPYVRPSVSVVRHEADGILMRSTGSVPLGPLSAGGGVLGISPASTPVLVGLLLPAVQAARDAARRTQAMNNLGQIMLAMHNYAACTQGERLPSQAICDADGRPLLSWRVALLPYLDEGALYREFHLDEPWDSEHNRKLVPRMPACLADPAATADELARGLTTFQVLTGPETAFREPGRSTDFARISDGTSNTLAVVEVTPDKAVPWTKPDDHRFEPAQPLAGIGNPRRAGRLFLGAFFDGHVETFTPDIRPDVFKAMVTPAAGDVVERP